MPEQRGLGDGRRQHAPRGHGGDERRALRLRETLLGTGAPPPAYVINTHHHGDHTYGNFLFTSEASVIAHASCRAEVLAAGHQLHAMWPENDFGDIRIAAPTLTYDGEMTLHVGDTEVRLIHPGVAHTTGDTIVWLPEQSVVFTGDLVFEGGTPFIPMGSLSGSLHALDRLRGLGARTVVPGHGPLTYAGAYDRVERYLRYVDATARTAHAAGRTPLEAAREAGPGEFAGLRESERLVANLHRAYAELDGRLAGEPLDVALVFNDMAEMNGGRPVACHA